MLLSRISISASLTLSMRSRILYNGVALFFMILLLYTGLAKISDIAFFKVELRSSPFLASMAGNLAWGVPIMEMLLVLTLIIPATRTAGLYITLVIMGIFTIYTGALLTVDNHLSCGCGGILEDLTPSQHLLFNLACLSFVILGIHAGRPKQAESSERKRWRPLFLAGALFSLITGLIIVAAIRPPMLRTGFEGRPIPSFMIQRPFSQLALNTTEILPGSPFIIIGFLPYCPHCKKEIADLIQHIQQFQTTRIFLITPFPDSSLAQFAQQFKLYKYPNITLGIDKKNTFLTFLKINKVPCTAIYDAHRRLSQVISGPADVTALIRLIDGND